MSQGILSADDRPVCKLQVRERNAHSAQALPTTSCRSESLNLLLS
jgi:hypothetical protein